MGDHFTVACCLNCCRTCRCQMPPANAHSSWPLPLNYSSWPGNRNAHYPQSMHTAPLLDECIPIRRNFSPCPASQAAKGICTSLNLSALLHKWCLYDGSAPTKASMCSVHSCCLFLSHSSHCPSFASSCSLSACAWICSQFGANTPSQRSPHYHFLPTL
jgi:hypothetical protein